MKTAWAAACRRAGITDLHLHDCRREYACRLLESHAGLHDVKAFLGHGDVSTTSRYLQATHAGLAAALARMEGTPAEPGSTLAGPAAQPDAICTSFAQTPGEPVEPPKGRAPQVRLQ